MFDSLSPEEWSAVALSLRVSFWATLLSLPLGLLTAYALARWEFWGKQLLNGLVHLPLILPPVVTGYALLMLFGREGWIGRWLDESLGIVLSFRWTGAALAAAVMGFPLMVRAIRQAIEASKTRWNTRHPILLLTYLFNLSNGACHQSTHALTVATDVLISNGKQIRFSLVEELEHIGGFIKGQSRDIPRKTDQLPKNVLFK